MKLLYYCTIFLVTFVVAITAQTISPKREFRAAWIASVSNIDWPTNSSQTPAQQQSSYIQILNQHELSGMNAVMVQIRPSSDALYQSAIEPWSEWLTGTQGKAPSPYYDPLP
ncbi:MAG: family 10 glycosylhydrolase, partial [Ignavibacteriales bacterium]|nr:family 10 glycosylhydrolase [Ignavibacteriales bacterium]